MWIPDDPEMMQTLGKGVAGMCSSAVEANNSRLLVVDDDPELLLLLQDELSQQGLQCSSAACGSDALLMLRQE